MEDALFWIWVICLTLFISFGLFWLAIWLLKLMQSDTKPEATPHDAEERRRLELITRGGRRMH